MTRKEMEALADMIVERLENRRKDEMVDVKAASLITGLSVQILYRRKEEIGYVKRGKALMFSRRNLEEYNRSRERC